MGCNARVEVNPFPLGIVANSGRVHLAEARVMCFQPDYVRRSEASHVMPSENTQVPVSRMSFTVICPNSRDTTVVIVFLEQCSQERDPEQACLSAIRRLAPQLSRATRALLVSSCPAKLQERDVEKYVKRLKEAAECKSEPRPQVDVYLSLHHKGHFSWHFTSHLPRMVGPESLLVVLQDSVTYDDSYIDALNAARSSRAPRRVVRKRIEGYGEGLELQVPTRHSRHP